MINYVQVKRIIGSLLLIGMFTSCSMWNAWFGQEEIKVGEYTTLEVEEFVEDQNILWVFSQLPDSSKLSGFLPSDTVDQISFKPDVPGEYNVVLQITLDGELEETKYSFVAIAVEDTTLLNSEIPIHLADFVYPEDTTVSDTPAVSSLTAEGDQRKYLSKIVSPGRKSTATSRRSTRRTTVKSKPSRGNLIPRAAKTFTIQISSWPSLGEAQIASKELLDNYGIDSYIQRAFFKDKDEIYYRLRVGNFPDQSTATAYAKHVQEQTNLPVWVDFVRQEM